MKDIVFKRLLLVVLLTCSFAASATQRRLVPVFFEWGAYGAYGSTWFTDLVVLNTGTSDAEISNYDWHCQMECPKLQLLPGVEIREGYITSAVNGPAAVLLIDDRYADQLRVHLRVRDTSRVADGYGTWLPVVNESSFQSSALHLLDIPRDARYRHMLRVYSMDAPAGSHVRVRIYATEAWLTRAPDPLVADMLLPISGGFPQYAELADLATLAGQEAGDQFRMKVEPQGNFHIWAMVSVTNNDTQQVTAIFPASN